MCKLRVLLFVMSGLDIKPSLGEIHLAQKIFDKAGDKGKKAKMASMVCWLKVMVVQLKYTHKGPGESGGAGVGVYLLSFISRKANPAAPGSAEARESRGQQRQKYLEKYLVLQARKKQGVTTTSESNSHVESASKSFDWLCEFQIRQVFGDHKSKPHTHMPNNI